MELHQLEAFETVWLHRSFTKAATVLFLTQPAITRQIAALEAELRTPLFERLGRRVVPTDAGEQLHRYAEEILRLAREARETVGDIAEGTAGRLVVGASSTLAAYILPVLLQRFQRAHPRLEIAVRTGVSAQIEERVREGSVDIGLVTTEGNVTPTAGLLNRVVLADFETCIVLPPQHPFHERTPWEIADLAGEPMVMMEVGTNLRTYCESLFRTVGVTPIIAMELDSVETIKRMVEVGLGVSLLPEIAVQGEVATGRLLMRRLSDIPRGHRQIVLVHRRDKYLSRALVAFLSEARSGVW
jgi:DNA-binding transcriptional LysR family regulator